MKTLRVLLGLAFACAIPFTASAQVFDDSVTEELIEQPRVFIPFKDLGQILPEDANAVLLDRKEFDRLMEKAARHRLDEQAFAQFESAAYTATVEKKNLAVQGVLRVGSTGGKPVVVALPFRRLGLTAMTLDGVPAPVGLQDATELVLYASGKGAQELRVAGSAEMTEISGGGLQLELVLPVAVAGAFTVTVPGDQEVKSNVPVASRKYDAASDKTTIVLTIGGHNQVHAIFIGNGQRDDDAAILVGNLATTVTLSSTGQQLESQCDVQVLRAAVRDFSFTLHGDWTISEVNSPDLTQWSVAPAEGQPGASRITVKMRAANRDHRRINITAYAPRKGDAWESPRLILDYAVHQRGYLLVSPGESLIVRSESLDHALRESQSLASSIHGLGGTSGRLYYHWGDQWSIRQLLAPLELRRESEERQTITVSPEAVSLHGRFHMTAVGREMYTAAFQLPDRKWEVARVRVNGNEAGFSFRVHERGADRHLTIELASPVIAEAVAQFDVELMRVPSDWNWSSEIEAGIQRQMSVPLIQAEANKFQGTVALLARGDLDVHSVPRAPVFQVVPVGRMASLGLDQEVLAAYSYEAAPAGSIDLEVRRQLPRVAATSSGLITVTPIGISGSFEMIYDVTRAGARTFYFLADRSLEQLLDVEAPGRRITSRTIAAPGADTVALPQPVADTYHLWQVQLDADSRGPISLYASYLQRLDGEVSQALPLIRPIGAAQIQEMVAVQAQGELAVKFTSNEQAQEIDTVDLPDFFSAAQRILGAYQLVGIGENRGAGGRIEISTSLYGTYGLPPAIATKADYATLIGADGSQQTAVVLDLANAGLQFLLFELPQGCELWSVRAGGKQSRTQRDAAGRYLLPIPYTRDPAPLQIVIAAGPNPARKLDLIAPIFSGLDVNHFEWAVYPPRDYLIASADTKLAAPKPSWPQQPLLFLMAGSFPPVATRHRQVFTTINDKLVQAQAASSAPQEPSRQEERKAAVEYLLKIAGRNTLPVTLDPGALSNSVNLYRGLQPQPLAVAMAPVFNLFWVPLLAMLGTVGIGLRGLRASWKKKLWWFFLTCLFSTLVAVWFPAAALMANGIFAGAWVLAGVFMVVGLVHGISRAFGAAMIESSLGRRVLAAWAPALALAASLPCLIASPARADQVPEIDATLIIPYSDDPTKAAEAEKILLPYEEYQRLYNAANPNDPLTLEAKIGQISFAGLKYDAVLESDALKLTLTGMLANDHAQPAEVPLEFGALAIAKATLGGQPLQLQKRSAESHRANAPSVSSPAVTYLIVPPNTSGPLEIQAVATPEVAGRRGKVTLQLPRLPAPVLTWRWQDTEMELEVEGIQGSPVKSMVDGQAEWSVPLGLATKIDLRWAPKAALEAADRTLTADARHDVFAFHWALIGASKFEFKFTAGEHDRFHILVPESTTLTHVTAPNVRDFSQTGVAERDGRKYRILEVRLHRPAEHRGSVDLRWIAALPVTGQPTPLALPLAAEVAREEGALTLHAAKGLGLKTVDVQGGRRTELAKAAPPSRLADSSNPVGSYAWPYLPFAISIQVERRVAEPSVQINQLVRISRDDVQLLASLAAEALAGQLFDLHLRLPPGYEVLSVLGSDVEEYFVQPPSQGSSSSPVLHVDFRGAVHKTSLAVVLVKESARITDVEMPFIEAVSADGATPVAKQKGEVAIQLAPALDAETRSIQGLRPSAPRALSGWLEPGQLEAARFAYIYEKPGISLGLRVEPRPTRTSVNIVAGVAIQESGAWYTYRLRYNIDGSPIDRLRFSLPLGIADLVAIHSPSLRSFQRLPDADQLAHWEVSLISEVSGLIDVVVNFALPIDAETEELPIPRLATESNAGFETVLAVQNKSRHRIALEANDVLQPIGAHEQRRLLEDKIRANIEFVRRTFDAAWTAKLSVSPAAPASRLQGVVDLLALSTVIDEAGQARYVARLSLLNRSEQFLKIEVPNDLNLWSAEVADQSVKPVLPKESDVSSGKSGRVILIPLVKTSLGGIPYDVRLYFAGQATNPIVAGVRLSPPAIRVLDLDVKQTTWSLFLPDHLTYGDSEGNMSPVAGTIEVVSIGIDTKLDQLNRLAEYSALSSSMPLKWRDKSGKTDKSAMVYKAKLEQFNKEVQAQIASNAMAIEQNRGGLKDEEYRRLRTKLEGQQVSAQQLEKLIETSNQPAETDDITVAFASSADNGGISENDRNRALLIVPGFVENARQEQLASVQSELQAAQSQSEGAAPAIHLTTKPYQVPPGLVGPSDVQTQLPGAYAVPNQPGDLLAGADRQAEDHDAILKRLSRGNAQSEIEVPGARAGTGTGDRPSDEVQQKNSEKLAKDEKGAKKQKALEEKAQMLSDSRLMRKYDYHEKGKSAAQQEIANAGQITEPLAENMPLAQARQAADYAGQGQDSQEMALAAVEEVSQTMAPSIENRTDSPPQGPVPASPVSPPSFAVATGAYALPVPLPETGKRLDFACPGGEPKLSLAAYSPDRWDFVGQTVFVLILAGIAGAVIVPITRQ
jgi:hypothetical protein